ncbi:MAG: hypothetical protein LIR46_03645 [Bacteroidota bacterium]|nr:hypothetical protein [Bacteroidota bacterium]
MTKIIFNGTHEIEITNYNRYTSIGEDGTITSNANVTFPSNACYDELASITSISSIVIEIDGSDVYSLPNINAHIVNISESLYDKGVVMTAQIAFVPRNSEGLHDL